MALSLGLWGTLAFVLMDEIDECSHGIFGGARQDSVAKIEDMSRTSSDLIKDLPSLSYKNIPRSQQRDRIEIPLNARAITDTGPCNIDRRAPIHTDHVTSGRAHQGQ